WRGQTGDFRTRVPGSMKSIHLVEYGDRYEAHVDSRDPHSRPLEHLVLDVIIPAAGMALAASAAGKLFKGVATRKRKQR
ncbi:MAG: hypothetical protein M1148_02160, partial [Candidatus Thermoplasmatota archaeon]|nr:hypothetical protein [Candidatus Thermoplasmatota archaeon]